MLLYIVRHGLTEFNGKGILQGHYDVNINTEGLRQTELLAYRLKDTHFDYIYSSDLIRARKNAEAIGRYHCCNIRYTEELRERGLGVFQGQKRELYIKYLEEKNLLGNTQTSLPGGGESYDDFCTRVIDFFERIYLLHPNDHVLFSTHGGVKKVLLNYLEEVSLLKNRSFYNTSLSLVEVVDKNKRLVLLENCIEHLT